MNPVKVRYPVVLLGLLLVVLACVLTPYNNVKLQNSPLAGGHFPLASFGSLLLLLFVINPVLTLIRGDWRLHLHELFLVWCMVTVATGLAYTGLFRTFIINITTPAWFNTTTSNIGQTLLPLLPASLFPQDPEAIHTLYGGLERGWDLGWWEIMRRIPWGMWLVPLALWGLFIVMVYMAMLGMTGLFSHQWIENEKMNFPLLRVVEVLAEEAGKRSLRPFLTHRYFLIGLSIPVILHLINGLHSYYPQVPQLPTLILAQPYIAKQGLLSGFAKLKIYIYPAFIGFAFLTPKQVSLSLWMFFILGGLLPGLLEVVGYHFPSAALGTTFGPVLSRVEEMQMIGAVPVFFFFIVWLARDHLKQILRSVLGRGSADIEKYEGLLPPRAAFYVFCAGVLGVAGWMWMFGMDLVTLLAFLCVCFMIQLVASRLICQGGLPYFTMTVAPSDGFLAFLDTRFIAPLSLYAGLIVQKVAFLDMRESLMPSLFHTSKLSRGAASRNRFLGAIVLAILVGLVVSSVAMLALYYKFGISSLPDDWAIETSRRVHENVAQLIQYPEEPKHWSIVFAVVGAAVMALLVLGFHSFIWWPLHPIGYLTTYSSAMRILWFSFFIGWLVNTLVLRYGGVNLFREVRRLFIGLVFGDMVMAMVWMAAGLFTPIRYHVLPI